MNKLQKHRKMEAEEIALKVIQLIQSTRAEIHARTSTYISGQEYSCTRVIFGPCRLYVQYVFKAQYPRLPFCVLFYLQLIILWFVLYVGTIQGSRPFMNHIA